MASIYDPQFGFDARRLSRAVGRLLSCVERKKVADAVLAQQLIALEQTWITMATPCHCDPPGSEGEWCTGHCFPYEVREAREKPAMTRDEAIAALAACAPGDNENTHWEADVILIQYLKAIGEVDVAEAWEAASSRVGFWYA